MEPHSDIAFNEETKHTTTQESKHTTALETSQPSRIPSQTELYWQNYNSIDGGKINKNRQFVRG